MAGNQQQQQQRKGKWSPDEDNLLRSLVAQYSVDGEDIDWFILEQNFNVKKRKFNDSEIKIIEDECSKHKFKWAKIAKKIPNSTPLMVKNFYNNRLKKKNKPNRKQNNPSTTMPIITLNNFN
ncbi:transcription factor MYB44-like [Rhizophagus clarus]|uniref:Transcription factor MYB44-like n=1 Tax=Rhizophagus clarus TaxID=94130 RepID=A0A8H3QR48_9GLOM|nr:transcription factor MYB44-like [Rhizophagus clarus]